MKTSDEYIFSGPAYLAIIPTGTLKHNKELKQQYHHLIKTGIEQTKKDLLQIDYPLKMSILFNAFTEKTYGDNIREADNFGFDNLYADSGGLQIVSRGLEADKKAKEDVYNVQSRTDYAMCFDEIPVRNEKIASRLAYSDRVFLYDKLKENARLTAHNIVEQINFFRNKQSNTKVFAIVQGNNVNDMIEWYEQLINVIPEDYWEQISGLAVGGVCLGFGQQEDVEKIAIYHRLRKEFGEKYTKKHLHILGVGAISRLQPIIILRETGFIPKDTHISYDSTSLSMSYLFGRFLDEDSKPQNSGPQWEELFLYYWNKVKTLLIEEQVFTNKELDYFYPLILKDMLCHKKITADEENNKLRLLRSVSKVLCNVNQIIPFTNNLYNMKRNWNKGNDLIGMLKNVTDLDTYYEWEREYGTKLPTKRITRKITTEIEKQFELENTSLNVDIKPPKIVNIKSKSNLNAFFEE